MTEEEDAPVYHDGDIVWVKLGSCWWPGEVTFEMPEDLNVKNPPIAIVKFFNETTFQIVKSYNQIHPYNCSRKNDFIRKGMDLFRGNNPHMEKFPVDVSLAETQTNGNPNILSDPIFTQQKRTSVVAEIFGSAKKTPKESSKLTKARTNKHSAKKRKVNITHRRFLGFDDYEAHIIEQYPGKDAVENSDEEEISQSDPEEKTYSCSMCKFDTVRLEVMIFHVQCHVKGYTPPAPPAKKKKKTIRTPAKTKPNKPRVKKEKQPVQHVTSDVDVAISSPKPVEIKSPQKTVENIKTSLVTEWSDDEDSDEDLTLSSSKCDDSMEKSDTSKVESPPKEENEAKVPPKETSKSCFDFDEDEDEDSGIVQTTTGRKIPRVIPVNDKRKSTDSDEEKKEDKDEAAFKEVMESTRLPDILSLSEDLQSWKKSPKRADPKPESADKKPETTEVATKLTNPKKRFVKSFEDFELLQNQQRLREEERLKPVAPPTPEKKEPAMSPKAVVHQTAEESVSSSVESTKSPDGSNVKISKLKCQIMSKLGEDEAETSRSAPPNTSPRKAETATRTSERRSRRTQEERTDAVVEELFSKNDKQPPKKARHSSRFSSRNKKEEPAQSDEEVKEPKSEAEKKPEESTVQESVATASTAATDNEPKPSEETSSTTQDIKRRMKQIDEYLSDFLFDLEPKPDETPPPPPPPQPPVPTEERNNVETETSNSDELQATVPEQENGTISTDLPEAVAEDSALKTLAMVSGFEAAASDPKTPGDGSNLVQAQEETNTNAEPQQHVESSDELPKIEDLIATRSDSEMVAIDGNLTVVSEKDLADGQVEIAAVAPNNKKPVTLTNFSMDFADCNSNDTNSTSAAPLEESRKFTPPPSGDTFQADLIENMGDLEEQIPHQILGKPKPIEASSTPKLLERLTTSDAKPKEMPANRSAATKVPVYKDAMKTSPMVTRPKFVVKSTTTKSSGDSSKPIILSEKIIKPEKRTSATSNVSVQKISSKRTLQDADEIDAFIIHKDTTTSALEQQLQEQVPVKKFKKSTQLTASAALSTSTSTVTRQQPLQQPRGKAKILQQTIITPDGEILQPAVTTSQSHHQPQQQDENVFDINSMPIVLSDQILTPESIENMPIFLGDSVLSSTSETVSTKVATPAMKKLQQPPQSVRILNKSLIPTSIIGTNPQKIAAKSPKILGSVSSKLIKHNTFSGTPTSSSATTTKQSKYVIVTQSPPVTNAQTTSKYTVGKKQALMRRAGSEVVISSKAQQSVTSTTPTGNKIMIVTNQQGQQQRVLLTPAHQKMIGYQNPKVGRTIVKGNFTGSLIQKGKDGKMIAVPGTSGISPRLQPATSHSLITSSGHLLTPISQASGKIRIDKPTTSTSRVAPKLQPLHQNQKGTLNKPQKTILIKNQQGQTVRKLQGTDDAILEQQVAEQLEAIKATGVLQQQKQEVHTYRSASASTKTPRKPPPRRDSPKVMPIVKQVLKQETAMPPLAPISPKKHEQKAVIPTTTTTAEKGAAASSPTTETKPDRPLHQLVIQDAMGNQTTITEGQILALPSETVGGQPQSYMLVTLDESGNLTPLNNEALLSLDPNLGLGGDLGNTALQIEQQPAGATVEETVTTSAPATSVTASAEPAVITEPVHEETILESEPERETGAEETVAPEVSQEQSVETSSLQVATTSGESGQQQLIVTGDPIAAQKFLESLTEGNTDLANLLASADGNSILIQADGQQILINADAADNQMLLSVTSPETADEAAIFTPQAGSKNQDILAAALADTDVFQQEQQTSAAKLAAQLSPSTAAVTGLYPINVGNVLETSTTLKSPIMTTAEAPASHKKIANETDILNHVPPTNVDLPITITDPNISHTVSQQQVAAMMVNELQNNLELSIPETGGVSVAEINSPSFVYSLPNLDGTIDMNPKPFNSSMPLLTEDADDIEAAEEILGQQVEEKPAEVCASSEQNEALKRHQDESALEITEEEHLEQQVNHHQEVLLHEALQKGHNEEEVPLSQNADEVQLPPDEEELPQPAEELQLPKHEKETNQHEEALQLAEPAEELQIPQHADEILMPQHAEEVPTPQHAEEIHAEIPTDLIANQFIDADKDNESTGSDKMLTPEFLDENEGLCTLGGEMCSSLSEPPPDMFDLSAVLSSHHMKSTGNDHKLVMMEENDLKVDDKVGEDSISGESSSMNQEEGSVRETTSTSGTFNDEDSCEIPLQPAIVTRLQDDGFHGSLRRE